jgi:Ni/Co efflux regulator RcnB
MKRPVTLALVASLLVSASAFAKDVPRDVLTRKMAREVVHQDSHHSDARPGNEHRGNDWNNHGNDSNNRGNDRHDNDRHDWNEHRNDRPDNRNYSDHDNHWDNRSQGRVTYAPSRYHYGYYAPPRGYYSRTWYRGDRLPNGWYGPRYVVTNWSPYHLYAPPYGYHWVRVGNDVLLTALATGVVLDAVYNIWF